MTLPTNHDSLLKVGIVGCRGRMGQMLVQETLRTPGCVLVGGTERQHHQDLNQCLGKLLGKEDLHAPIFSDPKDLMKKCDTIIDFTAPEQTLLHARLAAKYNVSHIIGTTGLEKHHHEEMYALKDQTRFLWAPNMSIGVNLMLSLVEKVARILDDETDIEIIDMHHQHKKDAPSGTAFALAQAAANGRGRIYDEILKTSRDHINQTRKKGEIGIAALRGGDVVGEHHVIFASQGERLEISHKASDRSLFSRGALKAAIWVENQPHGFYTMKDVIGSSILR